jgi:2,5-diketo-D-gluconate reductase B
MMTKQFGEAEVPAVGFGTYRLTGRECRAAVADALALGYRHIDTARAYENEQEVGRAIRESELDRDEVFVTTKIPMAVLEPTRLKRTVEGSLSELGINHVDLLLIHWPSDDVPLEASLDAMMELQRGGKTRFIGVSNFTPSLFQQAIRHAPVICNQVEYHPYLGQRELLALCEVHGKMLTAYRSFANGNVHDDEVLREVGDRYHKSPAQVVLRWQIQHDPVVVIPKAASADHRKSNLNVFDFELTREEFRAIEDLDRGHRMVAPSWGPDWEAR